MNTAKKAPRTISEFRQRLRALHADCGSPANAEIRRATRGVGVPQLAASTLSEFLSDIRPTSLPRQDFVRAFVAGCLLCSEASAETVQAETVKWDAWWLEVVASTGQPLVNAFSKQQAETPAKRSRHHVLLIATFTRDRFPDLHKPLGVQDDQPKHYSLSAIAYRR